MSTLEWYDFFPSLSTQNEKLLLWKLKKKSLDWRYKENIVSGEEKSKIETKYMVMV